MSYIKLKITLRFIRSLHRFTKLEYSYILENQFTKFEETLKFKENHLSHFLTKNYIDPSQNINSKQFNQTALSQMLLKSIQYHINEVKRLNQKIKNYIKKYNYVFFYSSLNTNSPANYPHKICGDMKNNLTICKGLLNGS